MLGSPGGSGSMLFACALIVVLVAGLFVLGDRALGVERRRSLGGWLIDELPAEARVDTLPQAFIEWFDALFRTRAVSVLGVELHLPRLGRSLLASGIALIAAALVWLANKGALAEAPSSGTNVALLGVLYGGATIATNLIPDYLSLVESRFVLGRMATARGPLARLGWLVVDVVASMAIVFGFVFLSFWLALPLVPEGADYAVGCLDRESLSFARMVDIFVAGLTFSTPPGTLNYDVSGVYIYSSLFTSFWVWIYLASTLLVRVAQLAPGLRAFLRDACRVHDYPLRVLAAASALVAVVALTLPPLLRPLLPEDRQHTNGMDGDVWEVDLCREKHFRAFMVPLPPERERAGSGWQF